MERDPSISIIIPMYNAEKYIVQCLESIANQTFRDFEVIIVDDGSTDRSVAYVESMTTTLNDRCNPDGGGLYRLIKLHENSGGAATPRNVGMDHAIGKYITFVDNDDLLTPDALQKLYDAAEQTDADVVHTEKYLTNQTPIEGDFDSDTKFKVFSFERGGFVDKICVETEDTGERMKKFSEGRFFWHVWGKLFRRRLITDNAIRFPDIEILDDMFFSFFCLCLAKTYVRIPDIVNIYRSRKDSVVHTAVPIETECRRYVRMLVKGICVIDNFLSGVKYFVDNPQHKHVALDFFIRSNMNWRSYVYTQTPPYKFDAIIREELSAIEGDKTSALAYLFSSLNVHWLQLLELQRKLLMPQMTPSVNAVPKENILFITMGWHGGSTVFLNHYIAKHCQDKGVFVLQQYNDGGIDRLSLSNIRQSDQTFTLDKDAEALTKLTTRFGITSVFVNHLITFDLMFMMNWIEQSGLPYTFFVHDYFCVCPSYNIECLAQFCDTDMNNTFCRQQFASVRMPQVSIKNWRSVFSLFLSRASHVYTPSSYTAGVLKRFYPTLNAEVRPHRVEIPIKRTFDPKFADRKKLRIIFLGNMLRHKGEMYLLLSNEFIQSTDLPIEYVVIGDYYDQVNVGTKQGITFVGRYDNTRVSNLLAEYETAIVAQLSICHETYCYTASEAILSGYPVLALNIGAHSARIEKHDCGWLMPFNSPSRGIEGRRQILLKADNTSSFQNGME